MERGNIFDIKDFVKNPEKEFFETLTTGTDCKVERIISSGHITPAGEWYDQPQDEWVILLQGHAILEFADTENMNLKPGDYVFIPAHYRHRVSQTSVQPECIWLAIHGNISLLSTEK